MDDGLSSFDPKANIPLRSKCNMFASIRPKLQKFWDSYVIFMESENHFQRQTKAKRYEISKAMSVCKILVKVFTWHLTVKRGIQ